MFFGKFFQLTRLRDQDEKRRRTGTLTFQISYHRYFRREFTNLKWFFPSMYIRLTSAPAVLLPGPLNIRSMLGSTKPKTSDQV